MVARLKRIGVDLGDDCAVLRPPPDCDLLITTDQFIENVHFRFETHTARQVGYCALARAISDIAAMGGDPRGYLVSIATSDSTDNVWIRGFYAGQSELGVPLLGGDTAHAMTFSCDIVVVGSVPRGQALRRSGAKPGDLVYVSGTLGGSAKGMNEPGTKAWKRHVHPVPRLKLGRFLRGKASACMDLSDGLSTDLHRLCVESRVAAEIDGELPVFPGASEYVALHGGEDYELLFTASPQARIPESHDTLPLTRIGRIKAGKPGRVTLAGKAVEQLGYDHLMNYG